MQRLAALLLALSLVSGCWLTRREVEQKILLDTDPAETTGDTGDAPTS